VGVIIWDGLGARETQGNEKRNKENAEGKRKRKGRAYVHRVEGINE
jgi:hypothetical protein